MRMLQSPYKKLISNPNLPDIVRMYGVYLISFDVSNNCNSRNLKVVYVRMCQLYKKDTYDISASCG